MCASVLALLLWACGGSEPSSAKGEVVQATPAAPAASAPAPAAPAAVGPDGPEAIAVPAISSISGDAAAIAAGKAAWEARGCGGCHKFGEKLVGPDLKGVLSRRTVPWVERMIVSPDRMVKEDPQATKLLGELMVPMPKQGVTDAELPNLIAFIHSEGG